MTNYITRLKKGDKAPDFKGIDQDGNIISLKDFKGKKLILYFYPQDNTPTCTNEACNLRDNFSALKKKGFAIIGVSPDNEKKHKKFIDKFDLPFPLIADTDMKIIQAYDVWGTKKFMGRIYDGLVRTTFVINEKGILDQVITKVDSKNHTEQILKELS
jgi:thioredoxin-dependent peroxiredoxin